MLRKGEVDLVSETPFSALELEHLSGANIVLHEWKKGVTEYSTVLVARRADKFGSLEDLKGKTIAFEDPGSTSGFLMPLALLRSSGLDVVELQSIASKPGSNQVGYIFGGDELNVTSLVEQGAVAAGALSNLDWFDEDEVPGRMKRSLEIFYESVPILRSVVLVRGDMQSELKSQIIKVFMEMHDSPEGWQAMKKYNKVRRFAPSTPAVQSSLDRLRPIYQSVRDKIR